MSSELRCLTSHAHHIERPAGFSLTAVCGHGAGSCSLRLQIADMSDVSSTLGVRMAWAERVAEASTWPKWANPLHVSPQRDRKENQSFPLTPERRHVQRKYLLRTLFMCCRSRLENDLAAVLVPSLQFQSVSAEYVTVMKQSSWEGAFFSHLLGFITSPEVQEIRRNPFDAR